MSRTRLLLAEWLEGRSPPVPDAFRRRLLVPDGDVPVPPGVKDLLERAGASLRDALGREGERGGAFRLLAADAWVTWACEEALGAPDPEAELLQVLEEVLRAAEVR